MQQRRITSGTLPSISRKGKVYATSGHILAEIQANYDPDHDLDGYIPREAIADLQKTKVKRGEIEPCLVINDQTVSVIKTQGKAEFSRPNAEMLFPLRDVKKFIAESQVDPVLQIGINAELLYNLSKAMGTNQLILSLNANALDDKGSVKSMIGVRPLTRSPEENTSRGVIMPMELYDHDYPEAKEVEQVEQKQDNTPF